MWTTLQNGLYYEHFFARFTIKSVTPPATITGTKAEIPPETFPGPPATCQSYLEGSIAGYQSFPNFHPNLYEAKIRTGKTPGTGDNGAEGSDRTYRDSGESDSFIVFTCVRPDCPADFPSFHEEFTSTNGAVLYPSKDGDGEDGRQLPAPPEGIDLSDSN